MQELCWLAIAHLLVDLVLTQRVSAVLRANWHINPITIKSKSLLVVGALRFVVSAGIVFPRGLDVGGFFRQNGLLR